MITVIVQGLFSWPKGGQSPLINHKGALLSLLKQATRFDLDGVSPDSTILSWFGVPPEGGDPSAAFRAHGHDLVAEQGYWLNATPVQLDVRAQEIWFKGRDALDVSQAETDALMDELNRHWSDRHLIWHAPKRNHWYVNITDDFDDWARIPPFWEVVGRGLSHYIHQSKSTPKWLTTFNENQMLLQQSSVNQARKKLGQPLIDGIWLWGGGELPNMVKPADDSSFIVYSDDALARGLAKSSGFDYFSLPGDFDAWLGEADLNHHHLLVFDGYVSHAYHNNFDAANRWFQSFEKQWLIPLHAALRSGRIDTVQLVGGIQSGYRLSQPRWWKLNRIKTLNPLIEAL